MVKSTPVHVALPDGFDHALRACADRLDHLAAPMLGDHRRELDDIATRLRSMSRHAPAMPMRPRR